MSGRDSPFRRLARSAAVRGRLLATLAGLALPLAFAPFGWYWLAPLALFALFSAWDVAPREAAWRGFLFGVGAFAAGTWWLYVSVRLVGGTPLSAAILLLAGLVALMAVYYAACGYLVARWATHSVVLNACVLAPGIWVLGEWLRGWLFTGFPWLSIGYAMVDGRLAAWAPVGGVYGVTLVTAVMAGTVLALVRGSAQGRAAASVLLLVLTLATWVLSGWHWTRPSGAPLRVSLVQGAVPQLIKWAPGERRATMERYYEMTAPLAGQDLVVWPEAAIPVPDDLVGEYLQALRELAASLHTQLLVGILTHDLVSDEYRNSLLALGESPGVYHKRHLVPFGEFFPVPALVRSWMRMANLPYDDIAAGSHDQLPLQAGGVALAPTICYEDAYGAEQLAFLPQAQLLVNVSNDAWFGDTIAPHQHLQMARMRALETGRYLVRSTNTGLTAIIDQRGKVKSEAPQFEPYVLRGEAQPYEGATPYVRTGNVPVVLLALAGVAAALLARWRSA